MSAGLEGDALTAALKQQVEFYFSPQNLSTDKFLNSQMNAQKYVPVDVIASFPKMKNLTENRDTLIQVIKQCQTLSLDETETLVRPNIKIERNTLILRDISASIPVEDVSKIFEHQGCAPVVKLRPDINDTWFVTFENEEKCQETALILSGLMFQGNPIRFGMKSSTPSVSQENSRPVTGQAEYPNPYYQLYMGPAYNPYAQAPYNTQFYNSSTGNSFSKGGRGGRSAPAVRGSTGTGTPPVAAALPGPGTPPGPSPLNGSVPPSTGSPKKPVRKETKPGKSGTGGTGQSQTQASREGTYERREKDAKRKGGRTQPQPDLSLDNFPALGAGGAKAPEGKVRFDRDLFAAVVANLIRVGYSKPSSIEACWKMPETAVLREFPLKDCQLLQPMPVMYPASPSPLLAAQPHHSSEVMSFLDLNSYGNPYFPPDLPQEDHTQIAGHPCQEQSAVSTAVAPAAAAPAAAAPVPSAPVPSNPPPKMSAAAVVAAAERESANRAEQEKKASASKVPSSKTLPKEDKKNVKQDKPERADRFEKGERSERKKRDGSRKDGPREGPRGDGSRGEGPREGRESREKEKSDKHGKPRYAQKPGAEKKADTKVDTTKSEDVSAGSRTGSTVIPSPAGSFSYAEMARRAAQDKEKQALHSKGKSSTESVTPKAEISKEEVKPVTEAPPANPSPSDSAKKEEKMSWAAKMATKS